MSGNTVNLVTHLNGDHTFALECAEKIGDQRIKCPICYKSFACTDLEPAQSDGATRRAWEIIFANQQLHDKYAKKLSAEEKTNDQAIMNQIKEDFEFAKRLSQLGDSPPPVPESVSPQPQTRHEIKPCLFMVAIVTAVLSATVFKEMFL